MNKALFLFAILFAGIFHSIGYGSGVHTFEGIYPVKITNTETKNMVLTSLKVKHRKIYNIHRDQKTGKASKKLYKSTKFSLIKSKYPNLISAKIIVDGKEYYFNDKKAMVDYKKEISIKKLPQTITLELSFAMGKISRPFKHKETLNLSLDYSNIRGSHGRGKIIIKKAE